MDSEKLIPFFRSSNWLQAGQGPRYIQLHRYIAQSIRDKQLASDTRLPGEREIAEAADVSRVTVRKAIDLLANEGLVIRKRGSGNYVRATSEPKILEQSLSSLSSFTEHTKLRGMVPSSQVIEAGLYTPTPLEISTLGLISGALVARIIRLRCGDGIPMAVETSSLPADILPNPADVKTSLYDVLRHNNCAPTRAIQKIGAVNASVSNAELLEVPQGSAVLQIDRTAYLDSGRPIEFTSGIYRSDLYEFISELRLSNDKG